MRKLEVINGLIDRKLRLTVEKDRLTINLCNIKTDYHDTKIENHHNKIDCPDTNVKNT